MTVLRHTRMWSMRSIISDVNKISAVFRKKGRIFRYAALIFGLNPKKRQKISLRNVLHSFSALSAKKNSAIILKKHRN